MRVPYQVLFICTGNSARSIIAEAIINTFGRELFRGYSAGSRPIGCVHPLTLELLEQKGLPTAQLRSKSWAEFAVPTSPSLDFIFTVCDDTAGEDCPKWPGNPSIANWSVPDPAAVQGTDDERREAFDRTYRRLYRLVRLFCAISPGTLDRMSATWTAGVVGRTEEVPARMREVWKRGDHPDSAVYRSPQTALVRPRRGRPPKNLSAQ